MYRVALICWLLPTSVLAADPVTAPVEAVRAASKDAALLPVEARTCVRYLWLGIVPEEERIRWIQQLNFQVNLLSTEPDIVLPLVVPGTDQRLLRLDMSDYGWESKVWERMGDNDPYFHVRLNVVGSTTKSCKPVKTVTDEDGIKWFSDGEKWIRASEWKKTYPDTQTKVPKVVLAPWVVGEVEKLAEMTQSQSPILMGPWFFMQTASAIGKSDTNPGYYQFLGIKDQKSFESLIGFRSDIAEGFLRELTAAVANSGVSIKPRRIARQQKVGGSYWRTFDNREALDKNNPLRVLNGNFKFDATEAFGHLPNGLWAVGLWDSKGNLQESAPDFVGHDKTSTSNDGKIIAPLSCFRCHANGGVQDIRDWARNLLRPPLALQSPDYAKLKELRQRYLRKLEPYVGEDRIRFSNSLLETNGLKSEANAKNMAHLWESYVDTPVTLMVAAREIGISEAGLVRVLDGYLRSTGSVDTVLSAYLRPAREQEPIPREQFLEAYSLAQFMLSGKIPVEFQLEK